MILHGMRQSRPPLARIQHIDRELRNHRYPNCSGVALVFEVSSKSIQRDIDFMRDMLSAPIEYDASRKGYFYRESWTFDPSTFLDRNEIEALAATSKVLAQYQGTPYYKEISQAIDKLMQSLRVDGSGTTLFNIYSFENPAPACEIDQDDFFIIDQALRERKKVVMSYRSSSRQALTDRVVHPYRLHYDQGSGTWYLIGFCEYRNDVRTFAVCRIQHLFITDEHFAIPESFSIGTYLEKTFQVTSGTDIHPVSIAFTPYQSQWIREHRWHPTQNIREHEDGSLTLTLEVGALDAVKRWVMQYGAQAEVLEPQELRQMVMQEIREMKEVYGVDDHLKIR
jgi:proteasome accessory factor B